MARNATAIERMQKGGVYFFVRPSTCLPVTTRDWFFWSDDKRWRERNYFRTREAVNECAGRLVRYAHRQDELVVMLKERGLSKDARKALNAELKDIRTKIKGIIRESVKE